MKKINRAYRVELDCGMVGVEAAMPVTPKVDKSRQTFGMSTILRYAPERSEKRVFWEARCACGNLRYISNSNLVVQMKRGQFISCGCMEGKGSRKADRRGVLGQKYGRLTVLRFTQSRIGKSRVICRCECGEEVETFMSAVKSGNTKSCGCFAKEQQSKSGVRTCRKNGQSSRVWEYRGRRYRSGLEVMYAAHLTGEGVSFDYEPQVFKLSNGTRYTPDFYLPGRDVWVEVKGHFSKRAKEKVALFGVNHIIEVLDVKAVEAFYGKNYSTFLRHWDKGIRPC